MVSYIKDDFNLKYYSTSGSTLNEHIADYDQGNFEYDSEDNRGGFFVTALDTTNLILDYFLEVNNK
jgi:hypothetical protein